MGVIWVREKELRLDVHLFLKDLPFTETHACDHLDVQEEEREIIKSNENVFYFFVVVFFKLKRTSNGDNLKHPWLVS